MSFDDRVSELTEQTLLADLDFDPVLPCESQKHRTGTGGHVIDEPATWIIERTHPTDPKHTVDDASFAAQQLVCAGRVEYIRTRLSTRISCAGCGKVAELARFIRIIGPIEGASA